MVDNIFLINKISQLNCMSSEIKLKIIKELIKNPSTGQQLAKIFGISKQHVHYNLKKLLKSNLIEIVNIGTGNKEIYYRAKAKNYIIDFSLGININEIERMKNRNLINKIIEKDYNINLSKISTNLLDNALKMKIKEKLLIVTGDYNMPLVRKILVEASKKQISTTLLYRDKDLLEAKHNQFSLAAYNWDNAQFYQLLKQHNVYLYLNGESRFIPLDDPEKIKLQREAFVRNREIIRKKNIRIAMMQGLINDNITEENILSEINFWKSLDIDYEKLAVETEKIVNKFMNIENYHVQNEDGTNFNFIKEKILCECGSFTDSSTCAPIINVPGGEVLFIPKVTNFQGKIRAKSGYIFGKEVKNPSLNIKNGEISDYSADENEYLIRQAIAEGGPDGKKISLITLGTNFNMNASNTDPSYKNKSKGYVSIYWGNNQAIGGSNRGFIDWQIQIEKVKINNLSFV